METVLITGCSSGYALETACHFHAHGWSVIATMRNPRKRVFPESERIRILPLDVTSPECIAGRASPAQIQGSTLLGSAVGRLASTNF